MANVVKCAFYVGVQDPFIFAGCIQPRPALFNGILAASSRSEAIAVRFKSEFPFRFQCIFDNGLCYPIFHDWNAQRPLFSIGFWDIYPFSWFCFPGGVFLHFFYEFHSLSRHRHLLAIYPRRFSAFVVLCDSSD